MIDEIFLSKPKRKGKKADCSVRYGVEHIMLPHLMYSNGDALFSALLLHQGELIEELYKSLCNAAGEESTVKASDFRVKPNLYDIDGIRCLIIKIQMPAPENKLECRNIYLCHSSKNNKFFYFASELNELGTFFLCAWTKDGVHLNFGEGVDEGEDTLVLHLFKELIMDGGLKTILRSARECLD